LRREEYREQSQKLFLPVHLSPLRELGFSAMKEITEAETALLQLKGGVGELLNNLLAGGSTA
jgi:hypothetical protein